jgi:hypothetical protein
MNKVIFLIIILTHTSCRYFNVSPVNGITTKVLTEKPKTEEFIGKWKLDKFSYDLINQNGYESKSIELNIKSDGSFEAKNFPNFIDAFAESKNKEYINAKGNWEIGKDFSDENWVLELYFEKSNLYRDNFAMEFELYEEKEKMILWFFVGDPDSGERLLFRKE